MGTITINFPAPQDSLVFDTLGEIYNYQTDIDNPDFDPNDPLKNDPALPTYEPPVIPNPQTKEDFVEDQVRLGILGGVVDYLVRQNQVTVNQALKDSLETDLNI